MKDNLNIEKLFKEKFEHFEADVNPSLWNNISQNIVSNTSAVTTTGLSVVTKSIIAITAIAVVSGSAYLLIDNKPETKTVAEEVVFPTEIKEPINILTEKNENEIEEQKVNNVVEQSSDLNSSFENNVPELNQTKTDVVDVSEPSNEVSKENEVDLTPIKNIETNKETTISEPQNNEVTETENENNLTPTETKPTESTEKNTVVLIDDQKPIETPVETVVEEDEVLKAKIGEIPNVFTPNGDGINDHFMFETENADAFTVIITDQFDKTVYESNNPNFKWDGTDLTGNRVPNAVYNYFVIVIGPDKEMVKTAGQVYVR